MKLFATLRHPLTGKRFRVRGRTPRELDAYIHRVDSLRQDLRLNLTTPAAVDQQLRRLRFGSMTLERAARSYAERADLAQNTRDRVRSVLAGPLRELAGDELEGLDGPRLAPVFERLATRQAESTLTTTWRTLRAIVRHAAERGWIARVPWGAWRPRPGLGKAGRPLREAARSELELLAIIDAAGILDARGPYRALAPKIACAGLLGLRQGELAGLRWYDLYPKRRTVGIRRQWDGRPVKTLESAEIEAPALLFALLEAHRARLGSPDSGSPIFPAPGGGHYAAGECLSSHDLRFVVGATGSENGAWSPHSLRDTFVTLEAVKAGGDLRRVQKRSRHRSLASLVRYLRSFERAALLPTVDAPALPQGAVT